MKDWKGNKNAIQAQKGIKPDNTTKGRQDVDFYATPPKALEMLLDHSSTWLQSMLDSCQRGYNGNIQLIKNKKFRTFLNQIWECACGTGNLYKVLEERDFWVVGTDITDHGCDIIKHKGMLHKDFLQQTSTFCWDYNISVILTNPPFRYATEFIKHALDILPENGLYIAFMNITYLAGKQRYLDVYRYGRLREVYVFSKRMDVWRNGVPGQTKVGMMDFAWFVFQKGYVGECSLYWLYEYE